MESSRVIKKDIDVGGRAEARTGVVSGSVWESRMKIDDVRGGFKVFNGEEGSEENEAGSATRLKKVASAGGVASGKRKMWKSEVCEGFETNPIQVTRGKTDLQKNFYEKCNELSVSADGFKKNTVQVRKSRSEGNKLIISDINKIVRSPIQTRKARSEFAKGLGESSEKIEKNSVQNRKLKPDSVNTTKTKKSGDSIEKNSENLNAKCEKKSDEIEKTQLAINANGGEETCKELEVSEKLIIPKCRSFEYEEEKKEEEEEDEDYEEEDGGDDEEEDEPESKQIISEVKKFHQEYEKSTPTTCTVKQAPPIQKYSSLYQNPSNPFPSSDEYNISRENHDKFQSSGSDEEDNIYLENHSKLQSLVDLVMWRDASRSAFVFGIGTFVIISSSYTNDINISFISVISYLSLVYLAAIFLYRSIVCRGALEIDDGARYVVGEEEALWFVKLFLPYLNEFLLKLGALFCGDPATTIKLAGLLFVSARCGSSITIWKLAKWGFFGVFTLPKIAASYSSHFTLFATFWSRRLRDAWNSCSHKKGVAIVVFIFVWNLSSVVARIWAAFMLFVVLRCYQQSLKSDIWVEDKGKFEYTGEAPIVRKTMNRRAASGDTQKTKKTL